MSYSNSTYSYGNADNYLFVKNMQGDIIHICDEAGNKVVSYEYDAWGNITSYSGSSTTAYKINPFRYRGYYYDAELGLYYLNSRYYDPATGRFINADEFVNANGDIVGFNMFAYCSNNPIMGFDPTGNGWLKDLWNSVTSFFINTFGFSANVGVEEADPDTQQKSFWYSYEEGYGYSKSFDNGKPINFYFSAAKWYDIGSYSFGIDININGNGFNLALGPESSLTVHNDGFSFEFGTTDGGDIYWKQAFANSTGAYAYYKTTIKSRKIAGLVAIAVVTYYVGGPALATLLPTIGNYAVAQTH